MERSERQESEETWVKIMPRFNHIEQQSLDINWSDMY